jgi:hypothetical protein
VVDWYSFFPPAAAQGAYGSQQAQKSASGMVCPQSMQVDSANCRIGRKFDNTDDSSYLVLVDETIGSPVTYPNVSMVYRCGRILTVVPQNSLEVVFRGASLSYSAHQGSSGPS